MKRMLATALIALFTWGGVAQAMPLTGDHYKPKWTQLPDIQVGGDTLSMHRTGGPIVADDFMSDGRDIYGFHWWGSYFQDAGQSQDPTVDRNVSFEISFHNDCPAGDATCVLPGEPAYNYSTPSHDYTSVIMDAEEDFFGFTDDGVAIYEYWALLPQPWEEIAGQIYWVDFGWNAGQFNTDPAADIWGWAKADNGGTCILDCAVQTNTASGGNPHAGTWTELARMDMAFEVITVPEPASVLLMGIGLAGLGFARKRKQACLAA